MKKLMLRLSPLRAWPVTLRRPRWSASLALVVAVATGAVMPGSLAAQTSADASTSPKQPCPEPLEFPYLSELVSRWTNPTGDVEFVVRSLSGVSTGGTLYTTNPRRRWLPPAEFGGSGGTGPWPPKPVQGIFPPSACPTTDGHNNICELVIDDTGSQSVPVGCNCEIELKPKGFQPLQLINFGLGEFTVPYPLLFNSGATEVLPQAK